MGFVQRIFDFLEYVLSHKTLNIITKFFKFLYKMFENPYFQNVASNLITLSLITLVGWIIYYFTRRSSLLGFFNIKSSKRIVLYLSNLRIQPGGAIGIDNVPRSFGASAIPLYEAELVPIFQRLFNFVIPGIESQPGFLRWLLISDVAVEILPSPLSTAEVERNSTYITVGSPGYNIASKRVEASLRSLGRFTQDNRALELPGVPLQQDSRCSFVQRVLDQTTGQTAFYVAGMSILGTKGAAYFLATQWKYLAKKYPNNKPFCIMLRILSDDACKHEILYERG